MAVLKTMPDAAVGELCLVCLCRCVSAYRLQPGVEAMLFLGKRQGCRWDPNQEGK